MQSCRFAFAVHVLAYLAMRKDCCSSARLAETVNTNPVVIRRLLLDLQEAGLVRTLRGPHGGAILCKKPEKITLLQVHYAVESPHVFGLHPNQPMEECPIGRGIQDALAYVHRRAVRSLDRELGTLTLQDVLQRLRVGRTERTAKTLAQRQ